MPISLVESIQGAFTTNGADVTLTFGGSQAQNDMVLVVGGHGDAVTTLADPGSGYTQIFKREGAAPIFGAWYKFLGASPDSDVVCDGGGNVNDGVSYVGQILRGIDLSTPLDVAIQTAGPTTGVNPDSPSITPITAAAWVFSIVGSNVNESGVAAPVGYSNSVVRNANDVNDITVGVASIEIDPAAAEDPPSWTLWNSSTYLALSVALRPAGAGGGAQGAGSIILPRRRR